MQSMQSKDILFWREDIRTSNLYSAIGKGDYEHVVELLKQGADPNMKDDWHTFACVPPLVYAIQSNNYEIAKLLLEYGADPTFGIDNEMDCSSAMISAIHIAKSKKQMIELLFTYGHPPSKDALLMALSTRTTSNQSISTDA